MVDTNIESIHLVLFFNKYLVFKYFIYYSSKIQTICHAVWNWQLPILECQALFGHIASLEKQNVRNLK